MKKLISIGMLLLIMFAMGCGSQEAFDDRYQKAKKEILTQLKDPDSYKMEYYKYNKKLKGVYKIKFRARNGYGGMNINYAYAFFKPDGTLERVFIFDKEDYSLDILTED